MKTAQVGGSSSVGNGEGGVGSATSGGAQEPAAASGASSGANKEMLWPAWVYCTRYSDRPSSGSLPPNSLINRSGFDERKQLIKSWMNLLIDWSCFD